MAGYDYGDPWTAGGAPTAAAGGPARWGGVWSAPTDARYWRGAGNYDYERYFGMPNERDRLFWQTPTGMPFAYSRAVDAAARPDSAYNRWLRQQEGWVTSQYVDLSRTDPDLEYWQAVAGLMPRLAERYTTLPGWQRGQNPGVVSAGRRLG